MLDTVDREANHKDQPDQQDHSRDSRHQRVDADEDLAGLHFYSRVISYDRKSRACHPAADGVPNFLTEGKESHDSAAFVLAVLKLYNFHAVIC